jgi:transposase
MAAAVRMRKGGGSLRQIGERLGISVATVHRDLARYERQETAALLVTLGLLEPPNVTADVTVEETS